MKTIHIDGATIHNEQDLHVAFKVACDFPEHYGMNWNAFIDCLSDIPELQIELTHTEDFTTRFPGVFIALSTCVAAANRDRGSTIVFRFL